MKHSDSATDFITRRDFMKRSALTVGAITLLSQGIGLASGTGGSSWWDMRCVSPQPGFESDFEADVTILPGMQDFTSFDLKLETFQLADPPDTCYNFASFLHEFALRVSCGTTDSLNYGFNRYDAMCNIDTGKISMFYNPSESVPNGGNKMTGSGKIGPNDEYSYDYKILIGRIANGGFATTVVSAVVSWVSKADPNVKGIVLLPQEGTLMIKNAFLSHEHSD